MKFAEISLRRAEEGEGDIKGRYNRMIKGKRVRMVQSAMVQLDIRLDGNLGLLEVLHKQKIILENNKRPFSELHFLILRLHH